MIRPSRLLVLLAGLSILLSLLLVWASRELWLPAVAFTISLSVLAILDARSSSLARRLRVRPIPPGHLYIGEPNEIRLEIDGQGRGAGIALDVLLDAGPEIVTPETARVVLDSVGRAAVRLPLQVVRRGLVTVDAVWVRWASGLGLNTHVVKIPLDLKIAALPDIPAVRRAAVGFRRQGVIYGVKPQERQGDGSDFDSLRDYAAGMNLRSIDWKHSAKHRKIVSKEFRIEQNHQVVIAIDTGYLMREPLKGMSKLDRAINAALILAYQALTEGDRVGLFAFDSAVRSFTAPVSGPRSFPRIQKALSELQYSSEETNFTLGLSALTAQLHRRALIVMLTDYVDTITAELMIENVQRLARRHLVMFVALRDTGTEDIAGAVPVSAQAMGRSIAAADIVRDRRIVIERLRRLGVSALDADPETFDAAILTRYLEIKQRELI